METEIKYNRFSDLILPLEFQNTEYVPMKDLVGKELLFSHFKVMKGMRSKFGEGGDLEGLLMKVEDLKTKEAYRTIIMSQVIVKQVLENQDNLPFIATIVRRGKYWKLK